MLRRERPVFAPRRRNWRAILVVLVVLVLLVLLLAGAM
jgi:preprotein translocase subunit SecE